MTSPTPLVVMLAGPNGAGKSTSAPYLLKDALAVEEFVNADTIAQGLSAYRPETTAVAAGRVMLERLHVLAKARRDFAFETTLAGRSYERWLRALRATGYRAHLASSRFHQRTLQLHAWLIVCGGGAIMFRMTSSDAGFSPVQRTCSRSTWKRLTRGPSTTTAMS